MGSQTVLIGGAPAGDQYERKVMDYLLGLAKDGVVDTGQLKSRIERLESRHSYSTLSTMQSGYFSVTREPDRSAIAQFVETGRRHLLPFAMASGLLLIAYIGTLGFG